MSYQSPIDVIFGDLQTKLEGDVLKVIQNYDITVDKDELLKALNYDRDQYHKGWSDGYVQANADIVHCKDCKWWEEPSQDFLDYGYCVAVGRLTMPKRNDFCSRAKRKDEDDALV